MQDQQRGELAGDEGTRLFVYDDATGRALAPGYTLRGHATIGVGRALDVHGLTAAEVDVLFTNDIAAVEHALGAVPWFTALDAVRQGVVVNLCFNMGMHGLLGFVRMIADLQRADFAAAANELAASKWASEVQPSRRDRLILQLRTGQLAGVPAPAPPVESKPAPSADPEVAVTAELNQAQIDKARS